MRGRSDGFRDYFVNFVHKLLMVKYIRFQLTCRF